MKILLLCIFLFSNLKLLSEDKTSFGKTFLKWKKVDKAISYKIEIQSSDGKLKIITERNTEIYLDLKEGKYTYRIGAVNKLGKVKFWSQIEDLNIIYTREAIVSDTRFKIILPLKEKEIFISGEYFLEEIEMKLYSKSGNVEVKNFRRVSEKEIRFVIPLLGASEEKLQLVLKNPLNKLTTIENFITLTEPLPEIDTNSKYTINLTSKEKEITIKGNNFSETVQMLLTGKNGSISFKNFERVSDKEIKFDLPLEGLSSDKIQLTLKNSDKRVTVIENFIELTDPISADLDNSKVLPRSEKLNSELWPPLWRSMLFPGFGQYYKEENPKAIAFAASTIVMFGALYYFDSEKKAAISRSDQISNGLFFLPGDSTLIPVAVYLRNRSLGFNQDADDWNRRQEVGLGVLVGIYAYNIFDIIKNHDYNKNNQKTGFRFNGSFGKLNSNLYFGYTIEF